MNIQFDDNITPKQAQGIILLLQSLFPALNPNNSQPVNYPIPTATATATATSGPTLTIEQQAIAGVPIPTQATPADTGSAVADAPIPAGAPTPIDQPAAKRTRRTKAQIEADEAAAKAQATTLAGPGPVSAPTLQTAIESTAEPVPTPSKPVTGDDLRTLLNAFIAKHSMEDALALLQEFKCNRVSEALSLEPATLAKLVEKLNA